MSGAIKRVQVRGLHQQLDIDLDLEPGLNVIYGKNGRGKTTLLHIIANILELDFQRFIYLQFFSVTLESFSGNVLEVFRESDGRIRIVVDGNVIGVYGENSLVPDLLPMERLAIRNRFGGRPVYLPAFRAILERVRAEAYSDMPRDAQFENIRNNERLAIKEAGLPMQPRWHRNDGTALTAKKTIQCREWFGNFVPVIRYPSLVEVTESLAAELREAQIDLAQSERKMLSEMFIDVFKALVSREEAPSDFEIDPLMQRVRQSLVNEDNNDPSPYSDNIEMRLAQVIEQVKEMGSPGEGAAQRRVLKLYAEMLEKRNQDRTTAFYKVKQFESSVNQFLDNKTLHVAERPVTAGRTVEPVFVETKNGRHYPLSSLSSGERQILTMLFSATRMSTAASGVFLIDEPELSLHVDWQRIVLGSLMAQAGERQIIACTHSPEVGADHPECIQMFTPKLTTPVLPQPQEPDSEDYVLDDSL